MSDEASRTRGRGADRIGTRLGAQDTRVVLWLSVLAFAGWAVLSMTHGAVDLGRLPVGAGATGLAWGLAGASALTVAAVAGSRRCAWGGPARLAVGAMSALVAWSALSMTWAPAPDLAWLATNRVAIGLAALVLAVGLALVAADPARRFAIGVAVAAVPVLAWALGSRVLPELLAPIRDTPRLTAPIGHANTLALVAVFVVPGALCLAAQQRWRPTGAIILMLGLLVVAMSGSRSGILALATSVALALWLQADRPAMLGALGAAGFGAVPAALYALTAGPLTTEPVLDDPAGRRGAGLMLGALIVVGAAIAGTMHDPLAPAARRVARWLERPAAGRIVPALTGVAIVGGVALAAVVGRNAEAGAGRAISLSSNNRTSWWGQAWRGFLDAPIVGDGAGGFPLTHIAERTVADQNLLVRQPHQLGLELLSELGVVGLLLGLVALAAVVWGARRVGHAAGPALAIVAAFLVQAQLDIPWTSPAATIPAMAAAGVVVAMGAHAGVRHSPVQLAPLEATDAHAGVRHGPVQLARVGVTAVVAVGACVSALVLWHAERTSTNAYFAAFTDPGRGAALAHTAAGTARLSIGPLLVEARALTTLHDRAGATSAARRAVDRQPDNPFAWECLAAVADPAHRSDAIRRWTKLDPHRDTTRAARCQPGW